VTWKSACGGRRPATTGLTWSGSCTRTFFEFGRSGRVWAHEDTVTSEPGEIEARFPLPGFAVYPIDANTVLVT